MRVTELDAGAVDLTPPPQEGIRFPGVHVSGIIRDLENTITLPGQRGSYDEMGPEERKRMGNYAAVGWAWECVIRDGLIRAGMPDLPPDRYQCPGQLALDGITGTPDWLDLQEYENVEFKATWRSSRRPLDPDFWGWLVQFKAYCKLLACTTTVLHVFYVNGDYREGGPSYKSFRIKFTELEIEDNWQMLLLHARSKNWLPKAPDKIITSKRGSQGLTKRPKNA